jgi:membrane protein
VAAIVELIKETVKEWQEDKASRLAAALAFYAILSIPPLLVLVLAIAGQFVEREQARALILGRAGEVMGAEGETAVNTLMDAASQPQGLSLATAISVALLFFGASAFFVQLQDAMNTVWEVETNPKKSGIKNLIRVRASSFMLIIGIGILLVVLLLLNAVLAFLDQLLTGIVPAAFILMRIVSFFGLLAVLSGIFILIFKVIPDVVVSWRDVAVGAVVTALLFTIGVFALSFYLQFSNPASSYGAAGSVLVLMLWIYYSTQIFFLGAEFTQVYANHYGGYICPNEHAIALPGSPAYHPEDEETPAPDSEEEGRPATPVRAPASQILPATPPSAPRPSSYQTEE